MEGITVSNIISAIIIVINKGSLSLSTLAGGATESASINMITDDYIHGYPHEGRMSAVRRFFCLFVTFDVMFIALLWIISVVVGRRLFICSCDPYN